MQKPGVTKLLVQLEDGDDQVYDKLYPLIYEELKGIAFTHMSRQENDHTLSKTELVHETYLKLIDQTRVSFSDKSHFLAIASRCMRQILIDYARRKHAQKRGGEQRDLTYIDGIFKEQDQKIKELIDIDDALKELETISERLSKVVEMRFFGEMTIKETAAAMGTSPSTVKRDWAKARGWLYNELSDSFKVE